MYNKKDYIAFKERESYVYRDGRRVEWYVGNLGLFGSPAPLLSEAIRTKLTLSLDGIIVAPKPDPSSFAPFHYIIHYSMNRVLHVFTAHITFIFFSPSLILKSLSPYVGLQSAFPPNTRSRPKRARRRPRRCHFGYMCRSAAAAR